MELPLNLWHLNDMKVILMLWTLLIVLLFLVLILSILFAIKSTNLKKSSSSICKKHDQTSINLTNVFDFIGKYMNSIAFDEIKWLGSFTKYTTKNYNNTTIYVNELILTPFSPFDIKCRILNLMWKTSGNVFLGYLGGRVFFIYPRVHSIIMGVGATFSTL